MGKFSSTAVYTMWTHLASSSGYCTVGLRFYEYNSLSPLSRAPPWPHRATASTAYCRVDMNVSFVSPRESKDPRPIHIFFFSCWLSYTKLSTKTKKLE